MYVITWAPNQYALMHAFRLVFLFADHVPHNSGDFDPDYEIHEFTSDEDEEEYVNVTTPSPKISTNKTNPLNSKTKASNSNSAKPSGGGGLGDLWSTSVPLPTTQPRTAKPAARTAPIAKPAARTTPVAKPTAANRNGGGRDTSDPKTRHNLQATPLLQATRIDNANAKGGKGYTGSNAPRSPANQKQGHSEAPKPKASGIMAQRLAQFGN